MNPSDPSTHYTIDDLAAELRCDESFDDTSKLLYVSQFRRPEVTVAQCLEAAAAHTVDLLSRRETDPSPDDPVALDLIAEGVEARAILCAQEEYDLATEKFADNDSDAAEDARDRAAHDRDQKIERAKEARVYSQNHARNKVRQKVNQYRASDQTLVSLAQARKQLRDR